MNVKQNIKVNLNIRWERQLGCFESLIHHYLVIAVINYNLFLISQRIKPKIVKNQGPSSELYSLTTTL
jgi:hypothetical protein